MTEPVEVILTDSRLPADHLILEGIDVSREPLFTVGEVAKFFFARSSHWMRWLERKGTFVLDVPGKPCTHTRDEVVLDNDGIPETNAKGEKKIRVVLTVGKDGFCEQCGGEDVSGGRTEVGSRSYNLSNIERMAHVLAEKEAIKASQLINALVLVQTEARVWSYL